MARPINPLNFKLKRPIRIGINIFLVSAFFIISPLVIFYTAGYQYDWKNKKIIQTGVISINIKPENAQVFLNDILVKKSLPMRLPNRAPGTYNLKIIQKDYKPWEKVISVNSKETRYIKDITLIKDDAPKLLDTKFEIIGTYGTLENSNLLLINQTELLYEIITYNIENKTYNTILRLQSNTQPKISMSPFFDLALIITQNKNQAEYRLINLDDPERVNLLTMNGYAHEDFQWSKDIPSVYIKKTNKIHRLSKNGTNIETTQIKENIWYVGEDEKIWVVDETTNLLRQEPNDPNINNHKLERIVEKIIDINEKRIIIKEDGGLKIIKTNNDQNQSVESFHLGVDKFYYWPEAEQWLVWSDWELWSVYDNGNKNLINRSGEKIIKVKPADEHGTFLIQTENRLIIFNSGYNTTHEILKSNNLNNLVVNLKNRLIYFLDTIDLEEDLFELEY